MGPLHPQFLVVILPTLYCMFLAEIRQISVECCQEVF